MRYLLENRHFRIIEIVKLFEFEDPKGVIRIRKSKKDRQHNGQKKTMTNNDLQSITQKTKDRVTRTSPKMDEIRFLLGLMN